MGIFVPPHLRVLHLSQETFVMSASLIKNVCFNTDIKKVGGMDRVMRICKMVGFPNYLLNQLELEQADDNGEQFSVEQDSGSGFRSWMIKLTYTDFARLNLARAFVMNPECLVLHKPTLAFDDVEKPRIIGLLRDHIDERGLELSVESRNLRRRI